MFGLLVLMLTHVVCFGVGLFMRFRMLKEVTDEFGKRIKELEAENMKLRSDVPPEAQVAAVRWVTYDGTPSTRPDRRCNEFNSGVVMYFTPLGGGTTMVAWMRPFQACRFPADIDPEDIPDDFGPDEIVWQRADKPDVVWLATPGDRWAYLPAN